jgi:hypothetical protein|tara:strand:+ start:58 stop:2139 length:2082 start_codon:yes stop_codon:yes gene_type:complete
MINLETKGILAKLLATENLVVEHQPVETASFNVETRVLTLPQWERASEVVYDLLVCHEVGHALYTPNEDWETKIKASQSYLNVTEDARVEKLMKRKFGGLPKTFFKGYQELSEQDFFDLENEDIAKMNLVDRINLHFKIGHFVEIPFHNDRELEIVDLVSKSETFEDALNAAEVLYEYCKEQKKDQIQEPKESPQGQSGSSQEQSKGGTSSQSQFENDEDSETEQESDGQSDEVEEDEEFGDDDEVKTDNAFTENTKKFINKNKTGNRRYYELGELYMKNIVVSNKEIHQVADSWFSDYINNELAFTDSEFNFFKKSAQSEVNFLVKEFEMKKSADQYSRTSVAKTGVLDCSKLHTYKYSEDLFKKINVVPDGKNHGLIFILDWSGSMGNVLIPTLKQLFNLIWFCDKVQIPFDVYAFTNSYRFVTRYDQEAAPCSEAVQGKIAITPDFSLMNLLTSKVRKNVLDKQMKNLWRLAYSFTRAVNFSFPNQLGLSGTPLNEALVCLHKLIPQFKKDNNVQKLHTIVLTDGEAHSLSVYDRRWNDWRNKWEVTTTYLAHGGDYLRNRKTGHTYELPSVYVEFTKVLLDDLRQTFPDVNLIGIRVCGTRDIRRVKQMFGEFCGEEEVKKIRKEKFHTMKDTGYTSYFLMVDSALETDTSFDVSVDATKTQIKRAFMKSLKGKALNKKVLSQFMDLVC